ncbi:cysteine-rich receptor-like protein kinase 10 [Phragmites australis]|uniref:cysteine-rich receptor-like protein kinase 10 n=1 Tax=Phragmites australis TaxID=29695 RepID=UPI002D77B096|nr:cysteine-rich receptor-like protein kinase 10 [Phragmites australis]
MTMTLRRHLTLSYCLAASAAALLLVFPHAPLAAAQPLPWQLCNDTAGNYTENSAYQANIRRLATAFPDNVSSSSPPALFATGAAGTEPDVVYALAFCRGDAEPSVCASCVNMAFQWAQQLCALNKGATLYNELCTLRYADWDFLINTTDNRGRYIAWSYENVSATTAAAFDAASGRLVNATADYAATDAVSHFGTGEAGFDETYPMIYSLAQCTPDMTAADCRTCLGDIIRRTRPKYFAWKKGGRVMGVRCVFRFETYPFFIGRPLLQLPGPPGPPPANMAPPATGRGRVLAIAVPLAAAILALTVACFCFSSRRIQARKTSRIPYSTHPDGIQSIDSLLLDLSTLRAATDNFAESNKLGEGGFGAVYKGALSEGHEIAVKRLSLGSKQGVEELKTELVLVAKLQHNNLVRLVGVCLEEEEKLLVYEYMPNRSLDTVLFDSQKSKELDWEKRLRIVNGVARGLQYLHEESRLKIVHRDLKPSNVLLDFDYNPKISDFGLAKLVDRDQTQGVTCHIAGTYGYMAPEYAMRGRYSVKSDVFSLGVLILEIVTGKKNSSFANSEESVGLLSLVWEHWTTGTIEEMLDRFLGRQAPQDQMLKLVNIGLLCVQDNPANRPTMSSVNIMLSSNTASLQAPSRPTFYSDAYPRAFQSTSKSKAIMSPNEASLTELEPR